jgi:carbamoylphosphate synthase large subunit
MPFLLEAAPGAIRLLVSERSRLTPLAEARDLFEEAGIYVAIVGAEAARVARDKRLTGVAGARGYPFPGWSPEHLLWSGRPSSVVKPACGSAGIGVRVVADAAQLGPRSRLWRIP